MQSVYDTVHSGAPPALQICVARFTARSAVSAVAIPPRHPPATGGSTRATHAFSYVISSLQSVAPLRLQFTMASESASDLESRPLEIPIEPELWELTITPHVSNHSPLARGAIAGCADPPCIGAHPSIPGPPTGICPGGQRPSEATGATEANYITEAITKILRKRI